MRKLTQKLVLSVVTMALVVVALGTSTFAWFTLQNSASIGEFDASVTAGEGIEVSLGTWDDTSNVATLETNSQWYTVIPDTVIQQRLTDMYGSSLSLTDATSSNGILIQKRSLVDGSLSNLSNMSGGYVEFKVWFRSGEQQTITLVNAAITGSEVNWVVDAPFRAADKDDFATGTSLTVGQTIKVGAWTAARLSIFNQAGTVGGVFQREAHPSTNLTNEASNSVAAPELSYAAAGRFGAASYYFAKTAGSQIAAPTSQVIPVATQVPASGLLTSPVPVLLLSQSAAGEPYLGNIVVRVWIEGWDADLFDALFDTGLTVSLQFGVL